MLKIKVPDVHVSSSGAFAHGLSSIGEDFIRFFEPTSLSNQVQQPPRNVTSALHLGELQTALKSRCKTLKMALDIIRDW